MLKDAGRNATDAEWADLQARREGGLYGVLTTGIFCRTGCPSRPPLQQNLRMFKDIPEALAAGFRPCLRCTPKGA